MEIFLYFMRSALCLGGFLLFYKLLLEKEDMHVFKRFYLLFSVVASFVIPFITFTTYVESPAETLRVIEPSIIAPAEIPAQNYWLSILWTIYGVGVLFFSIVFLKNLRSLFLKVCRNPKFQNGSVTNVLLSEDVAPHTFLNYIFLNKQKFEDHSIPPEVFEHEQAHVKQRHSLDILFIELIQVVLWFYPLIYLVKNAIKLNHEFLADRAVITKGANKSFYQHILLEFSSNSQNSNLVNAINYSSIKKRFTVMKTHPTKQAIWVRSLLLLPLLAVLIYSCSTNEEIEKPVDGVTDEKQLDKATPEMVAEYNRIAREYNPMEGISADYAKLRPIYDLMTAEQKAAAEPFPQPEIIEVVEDDEEVIEVVEDTENRSATPAMIAEYNKLAKMYRSEGITEANVNELDLLWYIYSIMTPEQRETAEMLPPPPPPNIDFPLPTAPSSIKDLPAPPPPPTPEESIKAWHAEGAKFYFEGKEISVQDALDLMESDKMDSEKTLVWTIDERSGRRIKKIIISRQDR